MGDGNRASSNLGKYWLDQGERYESPSRLYSDLMKNFPLESSFCNSEGFKDFNIFFDYRRIYTQRLVHSLKDLFLQIRSQIDQGLHILVDFGRVHPSHQV